ncbi:hypothetical protein EDD15DRAFT_2331244 [Pisolithus albus]|nr:hypothetical protein EDD15DRAFT_2331244 [Pisolithus albus]
MTCTTSSERCLAPHVVLTPNCSRICIQVAAILLVRSSPPTVESTARTTSIPAYHWQQTMLAKLSTVHVESDFTYLLLLPQKTGNVMPGKIVWDHGLYQNQPSYKTRMRISQCKPCTAHERTRASSQTYTQGQPVDYMSCAVGSTPIPVSFTTATYNAMMGGFRFSWL